MKIAIAQVNFHIGNFEGNFLKIQNAVESSREKGADLVLFPELAITGYPPRDFLEFEDFIDRCIYTINRIATLTDEGDIAIIIGGPARNPVVEGKDLFNAAFFIAGGKVVQEAHKALLPTYDIFDEYRYFEPEKNFRVISYKGKKIALTICEDIWNIKNENPLYSVCPMDDLMLEDPDFMVNISASPFDYTHAKERISILRANVIRYNLPAFYVNHVGAQTEIIFDGGSLAMNDKGYVVDELPYFEEAVRVFALEELRQDRHSNKEQRKDEIPLIHDALIKGIGDYFKKLSFQDAILGLSGGMDSALTLVLAVRALGADHCKAILMPSQFSSKHSVEDSIELAENLGVSYEIVEIGPLYEVFMEQLNPAFEGTPFGVAEENIQARIRAVILMAYSNKFGNILLNTSNKSETAVGYTTIYGDMSGGLSVLGDVYKTQIYEMGGYINRDEEVIPENILNKPPSAELRPGQKDSDNLPEYEILDTILHEYIEGRKGPDEIINQGYEPGMVQRILRMVNTSEYKRHQTPPVLRVSPKAFGMGRRMPIVAKYLN